MGRGVGCHCWASFGTGVAYIMHGTGIGYNTPKRLLYGSPFINVTLRDSADYLVPGPGRCYHLFPPPMPCRCRIISASARDSKIIRHSD